MADSTYFATVQKKTEKTKITQVSITFFVCQRKVLSRKG